MFSWKKNHWRPVPKNGLCIPRTTYNWYTSASTNPCQIYGAIDSFSVCIVRFRCILPSLVTHGPCLVQGMWRVKARCGKNTAKTAI